MFAGNWESSNLICVVGEQLPHTVVENKGWQWVNEGTAMKPKWGFVSWQVGSTLVLKVDTRASAGRHGPDAGSGEANAKQQGLKRHRLGSAATDEQAQRPNGQPDAAGKTAAPAAAGAASSSQQKVTEAAAGQGAAPFLQAAPAPASAATQPAAKDTTQAIEDKIDGPGSFADLAVPDMIVWVGYVKSWRHMGTASFNCIKGCKCQGTTVDALHDLGNTQQHMVKLYTTEAAECLIEVKVGGGVLLCLGL